MAKGDSGITGRDAAYIKPVMIPDDALLPRDNSGGEGFTPKNGEWDGGGKIVGPKSHLTPGGKK